VVDKPPQIEVKSLSDIGFLILRFSDKMIVPENLDDLKAIETTVFGEEMPALELTVPKVEGQTDE